MVGTDNEVFASLVPQGAVFKDSRGTFIVKNNNLGYDRRNSEYGVYVQYFPYEEGQTDFNPNAVMFGAVNPRSVQFLHKPITKLSIPMRGVR